MLSLRKIEINHFNGINTLPSYYASQLGPSLILALMISHKLIYDESGELSRIINTHTHTVCEREHLLYLSVLELVV